MFSSSASLTAGLLAAASLAGCAAPRASSPPARLAAADLLRAPLAADLAPGLEVIIARVEVPPNTTIPWHSHPGEEFFYIVEGSADLLLLDGSSRTIHAGSPGQVPFRAVHTARTGSSGARIVVFRVHPAGQPVRLPHDGATPHDRP
ncbi:MAG: cupin domain-containing protein [Phycisphaerales bacterium JB037]